MTGRDDYTIYLPRRDSEVSAAWRIASYGETGAFTKEQKTDLATQFDLTLESVDEFSVLIGNCLDIDSDMISFKAVTHSKAVERGQRTLQAARKTAQRVVKDCNQHLEELRQLDSLSSGSRSAGRQMLQEVTTGFDKLRLLADELQAGIDQLQAADPDIASTRADDARKNTDMRRRHVVDSCCYIWSDLNRPVSYTTVPDVIGEPSRQGKLVSFIQAVVELVTEPSQRLKEETIRKDVDRFKKRHPERRPRTRPVT